MSCCIAIPNAERLYESEHCCLTYGRKVRPLGFLYKFYHRVDYPVNGYLNHFVATRNTRASAAL